MLACCEEEGGGQPGIGRCEDAAGRKKVRCIYSSLLLPYLAQGSTQNLAQKALRRPVRLPGRGRARARARESHLQLLMHGGDPHLTSRGTHDATRHALLYDMYIQDASLTST